jgi:prepilin-type N-terminal cleavage/methylation domain-containing protein
VTHTPPIRARARAALKGEGGFTLLELLISLVVFSIGMLGLNALFALQIETNADAIRQNTANNIALGMIEKARSVPYYLMVSWDPTDERPAIPCQGSGAANEANRVDCLRPDTSDATVPPAPYNGLQNDAAFVPFSSLSTEEIGTLNASFTKGMEVKRSYVIVPNSPAADMKTITAQVKWRLTGSLQVHTVNQVLVRDMAVK